MIEQVGVRESERRGRAHDFKRSVVKQRKRSKFVLTFAIPKFSGLTTFFLRV